MLKEECFFIVVLLMGLSRKQKLPKLLKIFKHFFFKICLYLLQPFKTEYDLSNTFPLTKLVELLLEIISPFRHFVKLFEHFLYEIAITR